MEQERSVRLSSNGKSIEIPICFDGERESCAIDIDGIPYHFERIHRSQLLSEYRIDNDPAYQPHADKDGFCYIIVPFSK